MAKFWSSSFRWGDYEAGQGLEFKAGKDVSARLEAKEAQGNWVKKQTARTLAQAIMVPCLVQLHADDEDKKKILVPNSEEGINQPSDLACVYLMVKLEDF